MKGEGANVECRNDEIASLLPDYFSGHLGNDNLRRVEAHLQECGVCRDSVKTMSLLAYSGDTGRASHPAKHVLALYYRNPSLLPDGIAERIAAHLAGCRDCAGEIAILEEMENELRRSVGGPVETESVIHRLTVRYGRWAAYAAAACLLAMVGFRVLVTEDTGGGSAPVYQLAEARRGDASPSAITRPAGAAALRFAVPFYHLRAENDYTVYITDAQGQTTQARAMKIDFPEPGRLLVRFDAEHIPDGDWQLVVKESRRGAAADSTVAYFPFRLSTQR